MRAHRRRTAGSRSRCGVGPKAPAAPKTMADSAPESKRLKESGDGPDAIADLYSTVLSRRGADPSTSWTAKLFSKGINKVTQAAPASLVCPQDELPVRSFRATVSHGARMRGAGRHRRCRVLATEDPSRSSLFCIPRCPFANAGRSLQPRAARLPHAHCPTRCPLPPSCQRLLLCKHVAPTSRAMRVFTDRTKGGGGGHGGRYRGGDGKQ